MSWIGGAVSPMCGIGLCTMSGTRTRSLELDCLDRGRRPKIPDHARGKQQGHGGIDQRCSGAATQENGWISEPFLVRSSCQVYPPSIPRRGGWKKVLPCIHFVAPPSTHCTYSIGTRMGRLDLRIKFEIKKSSWWGQGCAGCFHNNWIEIYNYNSHSKVMSIWCFRTVDAT